MTWKLWLDERKALSGYIGCDSVSEAIRFVKVLGLPAEMDLDHDLGNQETAMDFLKWLVKEFPFGPIPEYKIHSQNPIGRKNIESFMDSWKKSISN